MPKSIYLTVVNGYVETKAPWPKSKQLKMTTEVYLNTHRTVDEARGYSINEFTGKHPRITIIYPIDPKLLSTDDIKRLLAGLQS